MTDHVSWIASLRTVRPLHHRGGPASRFRCFEFSPVSNISQLTRFAISEVLSLSADVIAVSVATEQVDGEPGYSEELQREWSHWNPGPPLVVLHTEFSSLVDPIVAFIDQERAKGDRQIVVLIPIVVPSLWRYRLLHNQLDLVLSAALHKHADVVVARVQMPLQVPSRSSGLGSIHQEYEIAKPRKKWLRGPVRTCGLI
jgi:hypothetical protein